MKMTSYYLFICFLIGIINIASPINSKSTLLISHEKYDMTKTVHDAFARISLTKDFNKIPDPEISSLINKLDLFSGNSLSPLLTEILLKNDSDKCVGDFNYTLENVMPLGGWGTKMIDSYAKPERGIFQGNVHWLGDFDECVGVYAPRKTNSTFGDFHGQYCTLTVTVNLDNISLPLSIGTCLPDSCHPTSDEILLENQNSSIDPWNSSDISFTNAKLTCQPKFEKFTTSAICVILLLSVFVFLATVGSLITAYERFAKFEVDRPIISTTGFASANPTVKEDVEMQSKHIDEKNSPTLRKVTGLPAWLERVKPFFSCFCILTNGAKLLDTSNTEGQLPCLHGIRFFSLSLVIVGHTYADALDNIRNTREIITAFDHWPFQIIMNASYAVDSFFLLSGFLLAYLFFEVSSKTNGKVPWLYFYIHRYVRITPVYMIILGFLTTIFPYMGSGPLWTYDEIDENCSKYFWRNLLYINNLFDVSEMCVGWSWYLANDMQFFVISPLILIALWRKPVIGYAISALILVTTTTLSFVLSYHYELVAGLGNILVADNPETFLTGVWIDFNNILYIKPYTRISPYIVGIALAYYLYKRKENGCGKNSLITLSLGWLISSGLTLACVFGLFHRHMSNLEMSFYNAFNRTCYAGGLAWVIYVCLSEQGGVVNKILSFKLFIPLSRLTFCAYLVHPIFINTFYRSMRSMMDFSHTAIFIYFLGFLVISYGAAFVTSLLFESPVIRLDKLVKNKFSKK